MFSGYKLIMDYFRGAHAVLLTATPFRSDRQELMSTETHKTSIVECIESKFIKVGLLQRVVI